MRPVHGRVSQELEDLRPAVGAHAGVEQVRVIVDEGRRDITGAELRLGEDGAQEADVGGHAADAELRERAAGAVDGLLERAAARRALDEHRVEVGGDLGTRVGGAAVQAHAGTAGGAVGGDDAGVRAERVRGVLGRDAALEGRTLDADHVLRDAQLVERLPGGDQQLRLHEVDVRDLLGHGVLDLDAGVHLDEGVLARTGAGGLQQELDGARVLVADLAREAQRVLVQRGGDLRVQVGRRRDLDDLLVAALDRAVALEEVHGVRLVVGQHLHLDVAGALDGLLDEDGGVAERALGLAHRGLERLVQALDGIDAAHSAPAAAGDRLDEEGVLDLLRLLEELVDVRGGRRRLERRHTGAAGRLEGVDLVAGHLEHIGAGTDERDARLLARAGQVRVLRQEAVAGVHSIGTGLPGDAHDLRDIEVRADRVALLPDLVGLVRLEAVLGVAVLIGEYGDGLRAQLVRCAERPDGDLATVGD